MSLPTDTIKNGLAIGVIICLLCLASAGYCQDTALMLEVSPANGGTLNLSPGVHNFNRDSAVTLTAIPKPGYQFVYWIGSVHDAANSSTMVSLDSPKIVIAVFERAKFDKIVFEEPPDIPMPQGGLTGSRPEVGGPLGSGIGGRRPHKFHWPKPPEPPEEFPVPEDTGDDDNPVPEDEDFPVPVPEPATIILLGTAGAWIFSREKRSTKTDLKCHKIK